MRAEGSSVEIKFHSQKLEKKNVLEMFYMRTIDVKQNKQVKPSSVIVEPVHI